MSTTEETKKFLPVSDADLSGLERKYLMEAFDSGWISGSGPFVTRLEDLFAEYCGATHGVACANGTVALHLALLALGIGPGDEVIVPSLTYVASANAVRYCGANPIFADCDPDTWNASVDTIRPLITEHTRCIMVVHLYGNPVEMDPVLALAREHGLFVLEDAAEAHGAEYRGKRVGSFGDIAAFSFYGNKIMTTGEGGIVLTNDNELAARVKLLRGQGMDPDRRYWFPVIGYNYRLTNLQAAIGVGQFERLHDFIARRREVAAWYREAFSHIADITLQNETPDSHSVWWMSSIRLSDPNLRADIMTALEQIGVETRPLFFPLHMLPPYEGCHAQCPIAENIGLSGINLPSGGHVKEEDVERIVTTVERKLA